MSGISIRCIFCCKYLISGTNPRQATCGDRLCGACFAERQKRGEKEIPCPVCNEIIILPQSFRDKAVEGEAANVTVKCSSNGCPWEGLGQNINEHERNCKFGVIPCPNVGCSVTFPREQIEIHISQCYYQPIPCDFCAVSIARSDMKTHQASDCARAQVECANKSDARVTRETEIEQHKCMKTECSTQVMESCSMANCTFRGTGKQLQEHHSTELVAHVRCLSNMVAELQRHSSTLVSRNVPKSTADKLAAESDRAMNQTVADIAGKLKIIQDNITDHLEPSILSLQESSNETSISLQTLQATTFDGKFVWKIPEVKRRQNEAKSGKTVSLYSAPFYTSRHGYKICLRLYMNGDGTGKSSHLSFFVTLMRGEYDALLPWPFRQAVTLTLVDQNRQRDIVQSFRPESTSSSFQRPRNEMNVASGCPTFAPVTVLDNNSYVKDDTMFFKCRIDTAGLENVF